MAERLMESEVSKSFTEQELRTSEQARIYQKLGELEDILEKYGVDIQNLDYILEDYSKNQGRDFAICEEMDGLKKDRDAWKRTCEFLAYEYAEEYFDGRDIEHCFNADKRDKFVKENINYFYQQAKKEG